MTAIETPSGKNKQTENFPVGSFLIRAGLRPHIHAFYQFARDADDISDNPLLPAEEKIRRLTCFAEVLQGQGGDVPAAACLRSSLQETSVTAQHSLDLLHAFKQDAVKLRYKNWDELMEYCRYSASPVGRHVLALHGIGEAAWPANDALCSALQVINHLQDCADDYREMDRVYLCEDIMKQHGAHVGMLSHERLAAPLRQTLDDMLVLTEKLMETARKLPSHVPDFRLKLETSIIVVLAEDLIGLLRRRDPLADKVKLSKPAILWAALKGVARAFFA